MMVEDTPATISQSDVLRMAVEIVSAYVSNNSVASTQVPDVINTVFGSLSALNGQTTNGGGEPPKPAVSVRRSVTPEYIVCLEDGKQLKMLKRHLRAAYGLTPDEYPMVAPNYAKQRSAVAKQIGLGRKKGQKAPRRSS
jgi:predicted transcriptional regulator